MPVACLLQGVLVGVQGSNGPHAYPHGAVAFHDLLERRREGSMDDVLKAGRAP